MRVGRRLDLGDLGHQRLVEGDAAGSVEHDDVVAAELTGLDGAPRDLHGALAGDDRQRLDADLLAEDGELLHRGRAARIERGHQDLLLVPIGQAPGDLGGRGRLARTLQTHHQDRHRRHGVEGDALALAAERVDQHVVDDLDDLLAGRDRLQHLGADGALPHLVGEAADDLERDVGLEQRPAHLAQRGVDVVLGQRAPAGQAREDAGKSVAQRAEHAVLLCLASRSRHHLRYPPNGFAPEGADALSGVDLRAHGSSVSGPVGG